MPNDFSITENEKVYPIADANPGATVDIVTALKRNAGNPPRARASFAKGCCVSGDYTPALDVASITCSRSFTVASKVVGRFSVGGGNPLVSDKNRTVLRGFSFRFGPEGFTSDLVMENAPVHFARTVQQMLGFLDARKPGADGAMDMERVKAFSAANPETLHQSEFNAGRPLPGSYVGTPYWAVHAFPATNADGETRFIKLKLVPAYGEIVLNEQDAASKSDDFLLHDLQQRIQLGEAQLLLVAVLSRPGDVLDDVTRRWSNEDEREQVQLGTLTLTAVEDNSHCEPGIFDPGHLAAGIGRPIDEMFSARLHAYAVSLSKRRTSLGSD